MARTRVRWRRMAAAAAVGATLWAAPGAIAGSDQVEAADASADQGTRRYVVRSGDTLWDIAARFSTRHEDPRAVVDRIAVSSGTGALLRPGQVLRIPVG